MVKLIPTWDDLDEDDLSNYYAEINSERYGENMCG